MLKTSDLGVTRYISLASIDCPRNLHCQKSLSIFIAVALDVPQFCGICFPHHLSKELIFVAFVFMHLDNVFIQKVLWEHAASFGILSLDYLIVFTCVL